MNGTLAALRAETPADVLSDAAIQALRTLHDAGMDVDAYTRASLTDTLAGQPTRWVIWVRAVYSWQECRFSPAQWQAFYAAHLARYAGNPTQLRWAWEDACHLLARTQPNGQLVPQAPREVEVL